MTQRVGCALLCRMRNLLLSLLVVTLVGTGCLHQQPPVFKPVPGFAESVQPSQPPAPPKAKPAPAAPSKRTVTPDAAFAGKIVTYNDAGRFVVMSFPLGHLPKNDRPMFVYREGLKVGELKVTGPQLEENIVADLVAGEARPGDEVRDK